jgi:hypothetical protein
MTYQNSCLCLNPTETTVIKALLLHFPSCNFKVLLFFAAKPSKQSFCTIANWEYNIATTALELLSSMAGKVWPAGPE